jgi:hypothetical protein
VGECEGIFRRDFDEIVKVKIWKSQRKTNENFQKLDRLKKNVKDFSILL